MTITHKFCSKLLEELLEWCLLLLLTLSRAPPLCRDGLQSDQPADELKSKRKPQRSGRDSVGSGEFFKPFANNHGFKVLVEECWRQRANAAKRKREASPWSQNSRDVIDCLHGFMAIRIERHGYTHGGYMAWLDCNVAVWLWLYGSMALQPYGHMATWLHCSMATLLHGYNMGAWLHGWTAQRLYEFMSTYRYVATWFHGCGCMATWAYWQQSGPNKARSFEPVSFLGNLR